MPLSSVEQLPLKVKLEQLFCVMLKQAVGGSAQAAVAPERMEIDNTRKRLRLFMLCPPLERSTLA